ncbi:MAG: hypothetical protein Q8O67_06070 [Deltaproteobacteria bacterium]|nr:hypothetical protein [Deltaproteobacteria bacterium]
MRSLPFPRRLQLVKLLRAHGLRDVERLREDELKEALARLSILLPDLQAHTTVFAPPPTSTMGGRSAAAAPVTDDDEDAHALPRFREPRVFLPDGERTFLRAVAVKPRVLFFTWELHKGIARSGPARIEIFVRDTLGDPPDAASLASQHPSFVVDVDAGAPGWYVTIPGERTAVAAAFVIDGRRVCVSNVALTPPARPAPPGPFWEATLAPGISRRALRKGGLLRGSLPEGAVLVTRGEAVRIEVPETAAAAAEDESMASGLMMRGPPSSPSSSSLSSSASFMGRSP